MLLLVAALLILSYRAAPAAEAPDLEANPITQTVESVDVSTEDDSRVRHTEDPGQAGNPVATLVSSAPAVSCRIAIDAAGQSWAVWQDVATSAIRLSVRNPFETVWTLEKPISLPDQICANPRIVSDGLRAWIAYEVHSGTTTTLTVAIVEDGAEPIPCRKEVGTTTYAGNLDPDLKSESGHIWLSWKADATTLSWSQADFATGNFTPPVAEPIGTGTVRDARARIRNLVLGP